jgi:hypothetical protein
MTSPLYYTLPQYPLLTCDGIAIGSQYPCHVFTITVIMGTAPSLDVNGVRPRNEALSLGLAGITRGSELSPQGTRKNFILLFDAV